MFNEILVPIDRSRHSAVALAHAASLARAFDSRLILLHAIDIDGWANPAYSVDPMAWQLRKTEAAAFLQDRVDQLSKQGVNAIWHVLEGDAAKRIYEFAQDNPADLIVFNAHGQSPASEWNLGGVVQKLAQHVRTSILLVRTKCDQSSQSSDAEDVVYQHILLPIDGSQRAECVLPVAATLSRKHGGHILLFQVVQRPEMPRHLPLTQEEIRFSRYHRPGQPGRSRTLPGKVQERLPRALSRRALSSVSIRDRLCSRLRYRSILIS